MRSGERIDAVDLNETEVLQDHASVFHDFGSGISGDQLSFGHILSRDAWHQGI